MNIRRAVTENSVWLFDLDLNRYLRLPRNEDPDQGTEVAYTGEWDDYTSIERTNDGRILVRRPVPFGTGALRLTGLVEHDDLGDLK